jgi:hypothetical protein
VLLLFTVTVIAADDEALKPVAPLYVAVIESDPTGRIVVVYVLIPAPPIGTELSAFPLSEKVTVPVGVPVLDRTVALSVTLVPDTI